MSKTTKQATLIGEVFEVPVGTQIVRNGVTTTQQRNTLVTVRNEKSAGRGKTRIYWKSNGYTASTVV